MSNRKILLIAFLCFSGVPALIFLVALAYMGVNVWVTALFAAISGVAASWEFSRRFEVRFEKPLNMLKDFFRSSVKADPYQRCDWIEDAAETTQAYNELIEKLKGTHDALSEKCARLETEGETLRAEINLLHICELDLIDMVTGLPNKTAFERHLRKLIAQGEEGGLVYIDVDNFLYINRLLGRDVGDLLLHEIGKRLAGIGISESFCARYSDDKFVASVTRKKKDVEMFCRYLAEAFSRPFMPNGASLRIETGIGAIMFHEVGVDQLVDYAHYAMQRSREVGASYYVFDEQLYRKIERKKQILSILRESILQNEVFLVFQPQLMLRSGEVKVLEALLRLKNKELGYISPSEFIPIAEANGLMLQLGYWVVEAACDFLKRSEYKGIVGVNVSSIQVFDNRFVEKVTNIIKTAGIEPRRIMLEIKENLASGVFDRELTKLNGLRKLGVGVAMDNFGTVYSSLNHMANLPIDTIKIDRSFINGLLTDHRKRVLVRSIIETSHTLGVNVCAEGVEDDEQRQFLHENGCDMIQGYAFSAPLDEDGIGELMDRRGVLV